MIGKFILNLVRSIGLTIVCALLGTAVAFILSLQSVYQALNTVFGFNRNSAIIYLIITIGLSIAIVATWFSLAKKYCWGSVFDRVTVKPLSSWHRRVQKKRPVKAVLFNLMLTVHLLLGIGALLVIIFLHKDMTAALSVMNARGSFGIAIAYAPLAAATLVCQPVYFVVMIIYYQHAKCPKCKNIYTLYDLRVLDEQTDEYLEHKAKTRRENIGRTTVDGHSVDVYGDVVHVKTREMKRTTTSYECECGICKAKYERTETKDSYGEWDS